MTFVIEKTKVKLIQAVTDELLRHRSSDSKKPIRGKYGSEDESPRIEECRSTNRR